MIRVSDKVDFAFEGASNNVYAHEQEIKMINTLKQSTEAYLQLLDASQNGTLKHAASQIVPVTDRFEPIENRVWSVITCVLPSHQNLQIDSGATLIPAGHPGMTILVQILEYDFHSGHAKLAVEEIPPDATGDLVIDFKWLIKRMIQWLANHGTSIHNPFPLANHPPTLAEFTNVGVLSDEQKASVQNLLTNPVAYVWGPPGTGKTRHVLAETVAHLIKQGNKVLVTAATNLAVDNALDAILCVVGVQEKDVLRIGLPSGEFREKWPDCCESRALREEMAQLQQQLASLRTRLNAKERQAELIEQLSSVAAKVIQTETDLETATRKIEELLEESEGVAAELSKLNLLCETLEQQLNKSKLARDALGLTAKKNEISILEREQTRLLGERQQAESQIKNLSWWEKLFTSRMAQLKKNRDSASRRLGSVEETLRNQRVIHKQASEEGKILQIQIDELKAHFTQHDQIRKEQISQHENLSRELAAAGESRATLEKLDHDFNIAQSVIREELSEIESMESLPINANQIAEIEAECVRVQGLMTRISQDLSNKRVLGMTLDGFIGLTMNQSLSFDHIVVDEAGYAPLAKVIPLCSMNCPISLLGDHCQLPPVYQGRNHAESECYWGTSALYLEDAFDPRIGTSFDALLERSKEPPRFEKLRQSKLTHSYRFDQNLADLLDRHFYEMELCSSALEPTSILVIDCPLVVTAIWKNYENRGECAAIVRRVERWLNCNVEDKGTLAVLSPYKNQVKLLRDAMWANFRNHPDYIALDVLTVNKAQGREWDTVFYSASDTGRLQGNRPFLSDTSERKGKLVVNTAISRAKKHLRIFCDMSFWAQRHPPESLLTELSNKQE